MKQDVYTPPDGMSEERFVEVLALLRWPQLAQYVDVYPITDAEVHEILSDLSDVEPDEIRCGEPLFCGPAR